MAIALPAATDTENQDIRIRRIGADDIRFALREGWADFKARRGDLIFIGLIYPVIGFIAAAAALERNAIPLIFPLIAGIALLGPAAAAVFYEVARQRERDEDIGWRTAFAMVRGPSFESIVALTGLLALVFLFWLIAAWALYAVTLGPQPPASLPAFLRDLFGTAAGWTLIIAGNLAGLAFAALALAIGVVSFPLLVDRPVSAATALSTSIRATTRNPGTMLLWGLTVAVILTLGAIPFLIGLAVALPVLGYATWHLYTRVVER